MSTEYTFSHLVEGNPLSPNYGQPITITVPPTVNVADIEQLKDRAKQFAKRIRESGR